jgi:pyruvate dehydrogenase E2 component (dihydrolipoamide acetyltransferase)
MFTFKLPELGEGLSEGEIVAWKVKEGDTVRQDQTLVEVMTDKATVEVPSPKSGVVKKLYYKAGDLAKVHSAICDIEESGSAGKAAEPVKTAEPVRASEAARVASVDAAASAKAAPAVVVPARSSGSTNERVLASPAVRRMAREKNIDLAQVTGSGDRGRVLRADLEVTTTTTTTTVTTFKSQLPQREERVPFIGMRRKIADRLSESAFTAVHFTHFDECDFTEIMRLRDDANREAERNGWPRLTYLPFFIKASIAALKKYPILNSSLDTSTNEVVIKHYYHYGISVQTDNGLMVAVVRDCDQKSIFELAKEIKEVVDRARSGKASMQDLSGSTITITNVGNIGGLYATPIINHPETVILGMYQIKKRPVVKEINGQDLIVSKPMMYTNITCDHRIIDGAIAAGYLRTFCEYIENPAKIAFM